jgi:hypothetical protein
MARASPKDKTCQNLRSFRICISSARTRSSTRSRSSAGEPDSGTSTLIARPPSTHGTRTLRRSCSAAAATKGAASRPPCHRRDTFPSISTTRDAGRFPASPLAFSRGRRHLYRAAPCSSSARIGICARIRLRSAAVRNGLTRSEAPTSSAARRHTAPPSLVTRIAVAGGSNARAARITSEPLPSCRRRAAITSPGRSRSTAASAVVRDDALITRYPSRPKSR